MKTNLRTISPVLPVIVVAGLGVNAVAEHDPSLAALTGIILALGTAGAMMWAVRSGRKHGLGPDIDTAKGHSLAGALVTMVASLILCPIFFWALSANPGIAAAIAVTAVTGLLIALAAVRVTAGVEVATRRAAGDQ